MYEIQLSIKGSDKVISLKTENRAYGRYLALLAAENADKIAVKVTVEVKARAVKFQGVD